MDIASHGRDRKAFPEGRAVRAAWSWEPTCENKLLKGGGGQIQSTGLRAGGTSPAAPGGEGEA